MASGTSTSGTAHHDAAVELPPTFEPPDASQGVVPELPLTGDKTTTFKFDKTLEEISGFCADLAKTGIEKEPNQEHIGAGHEKLKLLPNPESNYKHPDPPPANAAALKQLPVIDQEAFQRLKLAFDLLVCRTSALMEDLNKAVLSDDVPAYILARNAYMEFIHNLENRHPGPNDINIKKGLGYGRNLKETSVEALIGWDGASGKNIIQGARIQLQWNPHLSSSGIPIPH